MTKYFINDNNKTASIFKTDDLTADGKNSMLSNGGREIVNMENLVTGKSKEMLLKSVQRNYMEISEGSALMRAEEIKKEMEKASKPATKKESKPKAEKKGRAPVDMTKTNELVDFIHNEAQAQGGEVFFMNVKNVRSLKVDGNMFMAYSFSGKGVILWVRQKALEANLDFLQGREVATMKHMFDLRVKFAELDPKAKKDIATIIKASMEFQKAKKLNTKKALAEKVRAEKKAAKEAAPATEEVVNKGEAKKATKKAGKAPASAAKPARSRKTADKVEEVLAK